MSEDSVKVAVRVRPFNSREIERQSKVIIDMQGARTAISNPEATNEEPKKFTFDYSYWSHDGFQDDGDGNLEPSSSDSKYASQRMVFDDLGKGVLKNAFEGYNCSLFAYGQTGSGKSYSMVGYGKNRGIVPITCDVLFQTMAENNDPNMRYEVTFSMLEIYNEHVRDLLSKDNPKGGLQVHQNPKLGIFYVEGLKKIPVGSYREIEKRMEQGTASRTVASTNMNATSSRAHTVVTITFDQISRDAASGAEKKRSSVMNLVDLAGSERADSTGATGDRLKEGANINKSLSALGNVISALADLSSGSKKKIVVPYRDSVLTKLLQNALGGNSKTIMIAALSPADINYDETLSTLRYADRAKKIKNKAVINENPLDKMIRELKEENERLRKAMVGGGLVQTTVGMSPEEIARMRKEMEDEIRAQLEANLAMMSDTQQSWEERLKEAQKDEAIDDSKDYSQRKLKEAHFVNLNEDPMLSGVIYQFLKAGKTTVGRKEGDYCPDITLSGLSIQKEHAVIEYEGNSIVIRPAPNGARTKVNGEPIVGAQVLVHKDRVVFGSSHVYVFMNPLRPDCSPDLPKEITYEFAQKEIARAKGLTGPGTAGLSREQQIIQDQVLEILPMVSEANAISEELNNYRFFEVVLISSSAYAAHLSRPGATRNDENRICVMVQVTNLLNENKWLWERGKFMNRRYIMQELYQQWMSGEDVSSRSLEEDPFWEPIEDVLIGTTNMYLRFLCFPMDFDYQAPVKNYTGQDEGVISLHIAPCTANGRPLDLDLMSSDAQEPAEAVEELRGKPFHFQINVVSALVEQERFSKGLTVKYAVLNDAERVSTDTIPGTCQPIFNHSRVVHVATMNQDWVDFFLNGYITFELYAGQEDLPPDPKLVKMSTRELRQLKQVHQRAQVRRRDTAFGLTSTNEAGESSKLKSDNAVLEKKLERLLQKEKKLQQLCDEWASKSSAEQQFDAFYRAVYAVAHSSGLWIKARAHILTKIVGRDKTANEESSLITPTLQSKLAAARESDLISLHYFGEDEHLVGQEIKQNGGHAPAHVLQKHYGRQQHEEEHSLLPGQAGSSQNVVTESQMCRVM